MVEFSLQDSADSEGPAAGSGVTGGWSGGVEWSEGDWGARPPAQLTQTAYDTECRGRPDHVAPTGAHVAVRPRTSCVSHSSVQCGHRVSTFLSPLPRG